LTRLVATASGEIHKFEDQLINVGRVGNPSQASSLACEVVADVVVPWPRLALQASAVVRTNDVQRCL
jgi:hypothetical protein